MKAEGIGGEREGDFTNNFIVIKIKSNLPSPNFTCHQLRMPRVVGKVRKT